MHDPGERSSRGGDRAPWWLQAGAETCAVCEGRHHMELTVHCFDCDSPMCPLCVVEVRGRAAHLCPGCVPSGPASGTAS